MALDGDASARAARKASGRRGSRAAMGWCGLPVARARHQPAAVARAPLTGERLVDPTKWPHLVHMASVAAYQLARFDQAHTLAKQFLGLSADDPELERMRAQARVLADSARTRARRKPAPSPVEPLPQRDGRDTRRAMDAGRSHRSPANQDAGPPEIGRDPRRAALGGRDARPGHGVTEPPSDPQLPEFPALALPRLTVEYQIDDQSLLESAAHHVGSLADVLLRRDYAELRLQQGFDELLAVGAVQGVEHFWFQLETVRRLLRDFRGRALLADEVGLGKTIEACLALKEYWMRGLITRALVLTPASLVSQWVDELASKFRLTAEVAESGKVGPDHEIWRRAPLVVASLPLVRQRAYRAALTTTDYDLVIVDEAHVLKNRTSAAWQLVNELKTRFLFLLSATPSATACLSCTTSFCC